MPAQPAQNERSQNADVQNADEKDAQSFDEAPLSTEPAAASFALLQELAASLAASQRALLTRDLEAMEACTSQQIRLQKALAILWGMNAGAEYDRAMKMNCSESATGVMRPVIGLPKELHRDAKLQALLGKILHLGRVQTALLVRAQQSLKMICYLAAGSQSNYEPPIRTDTPTAKSRGRKRERISCRA